MTPADLVTDLAPWMSHRGASFPFAEIAQDARGSRHLRATADVPAGEVVLRIPRPLLLSVDVARKSAIGRQILAADIDAPGPHSFLAAYLLAERRRPTSPFARYIGSLPAVFPTVPIFLQKELAPVLRGTLAWIKMTRRKDALCRDFVALRGAVPAFHDISLRDFFWARTAIVTRVFGITVNGAHTEALVPMADMANHQRPPEVEWAYDDDDGAFRMKAARDIRKGEELHNSYGRKPRGRFFVHYGFVPGAGADDEAQIELSLSHDDPGHSVKLRSLHLSGNSGNTYRVSTRTQSEDTLRTFSFLRASCARERETARACRLLERDEPILPLSTRNEAAALALLDRACEQALSQFDTTPEQDDALLAEPDLPVNLRNALLVRRGEKRVLQSYRRLAAEAAPLLRLPREGFFVAALEYQGSEPTTSYLTDVALALAPRELRLPALRNAVD